MKFSVTQDGSDSVRIHWTGGPTVDTVETITGKYSGDYFDDMEDVYRHERSPWTSVFASPQYIFQERKHSVATMTESVKTVCKMYGWPPLEVKTGYEGSACIPHNGDFQYQTLRD